MLYLHCQSVVRDLGVYLDSELTMKKHISKTVSTCAKTLPSARTGKPVCHEAASNVVTGRMTQSGKLPVLNLLTGQKSGFSPSRGDLLHRFTSNLAGSTGTGSACLCKISPQSPQGWECGPQNIKKFHFSVKSRPAAATPLTDFDSFRGFYTTIYPTSVFQISCDSHHMLRGTELLVRNRTSVN